MNDLVILGVCGGNGVILHPFKDNLIANIEPRSIFYTPQNLQWSWNFGKIPMVKKLMDFKKPIDVIIGAPDCGHSSVLAYSRAKKLSNPNDNESLTLFVEAIKKYKPRVFMMENLPKFTELFDCAKAFPEYDLKIYNESVSKWGNSQVSRVRLVIVAVRKDSPVNMRAHINLPYVNKLKTVGKLIGDLKTKQIPRMAHVRESDDYMIPLYYKNLRKISVGTAKVLWLTEFERRWKVENSKMVNQPGVYRVYNDDYPLTVRKQNRQFDHYGNMLSPRQIARIQGIPDEFEIWYDEKQHLYCINKGRATCAKTPPYEIGAWFKQVLIKINSLWPKD